MTRFVIALLLSLGVVLVAGRVEAQYRYSDDKGVSHVAQYKLDVPASHRDAAVWIGPTGVGKPALSAEQRETKQRWDAYRRIGEATLGRVSVRRVDAATLERCRER